MHLLVIGGTRFLGRHAVEEARARGHHVTLFHRGTTGRELFPDCEHVLGDRDGGLGALDGRTFDAVLDTSGYVPRLVRDAAVRLAPRTGRYLFVSSVSVYREPVAAGADETHPLATIADPATEQVTGETYGALKALCERTVGDALGERALIVRPGLLVGPHDPTDRFPWWVRRLARGGETLAPGDPAQPVELVDVRDVAGFMVRLLERGQRGVVHAAGPATPLSMADFLARSAAALGSDARFTWLDEPFLLAHGVQPWLELPLWLPAAESGHCRLDLTRALAWGLAPRPLEDTVRDTLAHERALPAGARDGSPALTRAREADLLAAWHARAGC